jgi:hypothetical protein
VPGATAAMVGVAGRGESEGGGGAAEAEPGARSARERSPPPERVWRAGERARAAAGAPLFHARMLPCLVRLLGSGPARLRRRHQASVKRITLNRATSLEAVFFSSCERIRPGSGRQLAIVDRISTDNLRENLPMRHRVCPQCQRERRLQETAKRRP